MSDTMERQCLQCMEPFPQDSLRCSCGFGSGEQSFIEGFARDRQELIELRVRVKELENNSRAKAGRTNTE